MEYYKRYECQFDDGDYMASFDTYEEAEEYRNLHNFEYFSRWIRIYNTATRTYIV